MTARKNFIRVTVVAPGPGDGPNWYRMIRGPGVRRRVSCGTTDRAAAEQIAREDERRMNGRLAPRAGEDPLVVLVYDRHLAFRESDKLTAPNTRRSYRSIRGAIARAFDGVRASEMTAPRVRQGQRALLDVIGLEASTANLYLRKLSRAWRWAHDAEHAGVGPWPKVEALPSDPTEKRQYTAPELERVLAEAQRYAGGRYVPLFCLLGENGARISEACALRERDVDRGGGFLRLTATKTRRRQRSRTVAVSPEVLAMLPVRAELDELVFRGIEDATKPLAPRTVNCALAKILDRAGLAGEPLDLHSFRRYVVRKLHTAGVPLKDAMAFVGHDSVATHLGYMRDVASPDQHGLLAQARGQHDHLGALAPARVPGRVEGEKWPISCTDSKSPTSAARRKDRRAGLDPGSPPLGRLVGSRDESGEDRRRSKRLRLDRSTEAKDYAGLMAMASPAQRRAAIRLAAEGMLDHVTVRLARDRWPQDLEAAPAKKREKRTS